MSNDDEAKVTALLDQNLANLELLSANTSVPIPDLKGIQLGQMVPGGCIPGVQSGNATADLSNQALANIDQIKLNGQPSFSSLSSGTIPILWPSLQLSGNWVAHQPCQQPVEDRDFTGSFSSALSNVTATVSFTVNSSFMFQITQIQADIPSLSLSVQADHASPSQQEWINEILNSQLIVKSFREQLIAQINSEQTREALNNLLSNLIQANDAAL